eukprot:12893632-Prorocentrum_lima.AAC.1
MEYSKGDVGRVVGVGRGRQGKWWAGRSRKGGRLRAGCGGWLAGHFAPGGCTSGHTARRRSRYRRRRPSRAPCSRAWRRG